MLRRAAQTTDRLPAAVLTGELDAARPAIERQMSVAELEALLAELGDNALVHQAPAERAPGEGATVRNSAAELQRAVPKRIVVSSSSWTGRAENAPAPIELLRGFFAQALGGLGRRTTPAQVQALEERALEVLEALNPKAPGEAERAFGAWLEGVEQRTSSGAPINAIEYLAVVHILKQRMFEGAPELAALLPRMEATAVEMHRRLTGATIEAQDLSEGRLPLSFLAGQRRDVQQIHGAIFNSTDESFRATLGNLLQSYVPRPQDPLIAVSLLTLLFTHAGAQVLAGAVHGYLLCTLLEHVIHKYGGHANKKTLERLDPLLSRLGPLGRSIRRQIEELAFGHGTVHHGAYAGSYTEAFAPRDLALPPAEAARKTAQKKAQIDAMIAAREPDEQRSIEQSRYGVSVAEPLVNALKTMPVTAVLTLFTNFVANQLGADLGVLFSATSIAASLLFIPVSTFVHPYLHMTREEAMKEAGPLMRIFLRSRMVGMMAKDHYRHHRDAVNANYNLVRGADMALGDQKDPHLKTVLDLRRMKTFY